MYFALSDRWGGRPTRAYVTNVKEKKKWIEGWRIKNFFDICFAILSFVVFLLLEAALIYSYFVFIRLL